MSGVLLSYTPTVAEDLTEDAATKDIALHLQQLLVADNVGSSQTANVGSDDYLDQLAPIIKDALAKQHAEELTSILDNITRSKDQEIESLCNGNQNVSTFSYINAQLFV